MGVFDAAGAAITGALDWCQVNGFLDDLKARVGELPDMEIHGDGLLVKRHPHFPRSELEAELARASECIEEARQICIAVLEALP
jgi:hypothetical protein